MTIDRPNLADAFRKHPVDRAAGLSGLLPTNRLQHRPGVTAADEGHPTASSSIAPADTASIPEPLGQPSHQSPGRAAKTASERVNLITNVAVYLEPDLLDATRERRRLTGASYDELTGDAFAAISDEQLSRIFQPQPAVTTTAGMPTRQRRVRGTAGIQVQLRLDTNQRAWLDEKQLTVGAPSRSALVAAALRLHFTM